MAGRIRTLKPELLEDERVAALSSDAFRLFVGAILLADDYGNLRIAAGMLAGQVFWRLTEMGAVTIPQIESAIAELVAPGPPDPKTGTPRPGLLTPYRVRDQVYAHVTGWERHQKVDRPGQPRVPSASDPDAESCSYDFAHVRKIRETLARQSRLTSDLRPPIPTSDPDHQDPAFAGSEPGGSGSSAGPARSQTEHQLQTGSAQPTEAPALPSPLPPLPASKTSTPAPPPLPVQPALPMPGAEPSTPESRARDVFDAYLDGWKKKHVGSTRAPKLDDKRRRLIAARLRDFPLADLIAAARGVWLSDWHVENKRTDFDLVFRDVAHVERFRDLAFGASEKATGGPAADLSEYDGKRRPRIAPRPPDAPPGEIGPRLYTVPDIELPPIPEGGTVFDLAHMMFARTEPTPEHNGSAELFGASKRSA